MNRIVFAALSLFALLVSNQLFAQSEIVAGYGIFSAQEVKHICSTSYSSNVVTLKGSIDSYVEGRGPWVLGYKYRFNETISAGVVGAYSSTRVSYYLTNIPIDSEGERQVVRTSYYAAMARLSFTWFKVRNMLAYSEFSGGSSYSTAKNRSESIVEKKLSLAYQVNAIGFRLGGKLGAYLELGYGDAGIANVGMSLVF